MSSRWLGWLGLALALCLGGAAEAQQAATGPAPTIHSGTKLSFLPTLGGAELQRSASFGTSAVEYLYLVNKMQIAVIIYDDNGRHVPFGSETPSLMRNFAAETDLLAQQIRGSGITQIERPTVPSTCVFGIISFRCITLSASTPSGRLYTKLLMTGYRDYFLKVRISWAQNTGQTSADADQALKAFLGALLH